MDKQRIMKKTTRNKIILPLIASLVIFGLAGTVYAQSLNADPLVFSGTAGSTFNVSVVVNSLGERVCAVEGVVEFNNLSCQGISLATGIMPQKSPTCTSPSFLIGIPQCTTENRNLFTVSVAGTSPGSASLSFSGVDIIGVGESLSSTSVGGNYTITAAPVPVAEPEPIPVAEPEEPLEEEVDVEEPETAEEEVEEELEELAEGENFLLAAIGGAWDGVTNSVFLMALLVIIVLAIITFSVPSLRRLVRGKKDQ